MSEPSYMQKQLMKRMSPLEALGEGTYRCSIRFDPEFPGFDGHFPGQPIVPALCLLSVVEIIARQATGMHELRFSKISSMKFKAPLRPGDMAIFTVDIDNGGQLPFKASATVSTETQAEISKMKLVFMP